MPDIKIRFNLTLPFELNQKLELYLLKNPTVNKTKLIRAAIQNWLDQQESK